MKKLSYLLSAGVLVAMLAVVGCSKDDGNDPSPTDLAGTNFSGTWAVDENVANSVTFDDGTQQDRTDLYSDFTINVSHQAGTTEGSFIVDGGDIGSSPFQQGSSLWEFQSETPNVNSFNIVRTSDELVIMVSNLTETTATLSFNLGASNSTGRTEAVVGDWVFNLVSQ